MLREALAGAVLVCVLIAPWAAGEPACSTTEGARAASAGSVAVGSSTVECEDNEGRARWTRHQYGASEATTGAGVFVADDSFTHATEHFSCRSEAHGVVVRTRDASAWAGVEDVGCEMADDGGFRSRAASARLDAMGREEATSAAFVAQWWDGGAGEREDHAMVLGVHVVREGGACHVWEWPSHDLPADACRATDALASTLMGVPLVPLHP